MPVPPLFVGLVAYKFIDGPLIDASGSEAADEAVSQYVETPQHLPLRAGKRPLEVIVGLVARHRQDTPQLSTMHRRHPSLLRRWPLLLILMACRLAPLLAANDLSGLAEEMLAARVDGEPCAEDLF